MTAITIERHKASSYEGGYFYRLPVLMEQRERVMAEHIGFEQLRDYSACAFRHRCMLAEAHDWFIKIIDAPLDN